MLPTFLITCAVFLLAVVGLASGLILRGRRLRGSCGGLANLTDPEGNVRCQLCATPSPDCTGEPEQTAEAASGEAGLLDAPAARS